MRAARNLGRFTEAADLTIKATRPNPYGFLSTQARNASVKYGVHSISLLAVKPGR
ncbi:MAG TPA: hypothetical protein VKA58_13395 [Propionibacteriaceae bacterium]|nr:hypothetical protein [Propionibacteriaceae bacterium]